VAKDGAVRRLFEQGRRLLWLLEMRGVFLLAEQLSAFPL
jgi:hypothetical protein